MRRIGILTSGGDCQALNATMRGVAKSLYNMLDDVEIIGFEDGYKGLMYADYQIMKPADFSGILTQGGTILGTSRQPFKQMRVPDENGLDKVEAMKHTYKKLKLSCLVVLGGNGSQKTANMLSEEGLNVVSLPKTIDNDLWGTDMTFGFQSAVEVATNAIDCIHTTATRRGEDLAARLPDRLLHRLRGLLRYPNLSATGRCGADRREDDRGRRDRTGYAGLFLYDERPDEDADRSLLRALHRDDGQGVLFYRGGGRRQQGCHGTDDRRFSRFSGLSRRFPRMRYDLRRWGVENR